MTRWLWAAVALLLIAAVVLFSRDHAAAGSDAGRVQGERADEAAAFAAARKLARIEARPAPARAAHVLLRAGWGSGESELGRRVADESAPEGPMSLAVGADGRIWVLDQVNGRVRRFGADGKPDGGFAIGPDTAQDLALLPDGRVVVLDRLGQQSLLAYDENGKLLGEQSLLGGGITEGGAVTGLLVAPDGLYLEREHTETLHVASADGAADEDRPAHPGRPTRDGTLFLAAQLTDAAGGAAVVRAFDGDGRVVWQKQLVFPAPVLHLVLLDSDRRGHVFIGALCAEEGGPPEHQLVDPRLVVARLEQSSGAAAGSLAIPASPLAEEVFRELVVTDDGAILHLYVGDDGVEVRRYEIE